jgi:hypothetical protein|uniref:Uncharacterized protein n=1 Tax=Picea glauca TaxID=3330 RepID=A0A117NFN6_PICGL|nr:hypothetical protein ABT39_MTgene2645 [Picea glauca]
MKIVDLGHDFFLIQFEKREDYFKPEWWGRRPVDHCGPLFYYTEMVHKFKTISGENIQNNGLGSFP